VVRDLHDGAQARLVHTVITLKFARRAAENGEGETLGLLTEALDHAERATAELRELAHGILPEALTRGGLRTGLDALASRMPLPVKNSVSVGRLSAVVEATRPEVVVLLNLSRDQLDRMEEVRSTASRWREGLSLDAAARTTVVANADDPIVVAAVPENAKTVWVGAGLRWRDDAATCPWCGQRIVWDSDDQWRCAECGRTRPAVSWQLDGAALHTGDGGRVELVLAVPGRHNLANAAMAIAAAAQLGVTAADAARACATVEHIAGRYQPAWGPAHRGRVYLAKNPAGWIETLDVLDADRRPVVLAFNSNGPDGRDPSWIYDVAFERLADRRVIVTGERATDLSVRLRYADVVHRVVTPLAAALAEGRDLDADVIASYTAFGAVRHELDDG